MGGLIRPCYESHSKSKNSSGFIVNPRAAGSGPDKLANYIRYGGRAHRSADGAAFRLPRPQPHFNRRLRDRLSRWHAHPAVAPIVYEIPVQLLAYHTAVFMGTDVDQPRNLAKSVTVE
jgi:hypothetical protein